MGLSAEAAGRVGAAWVDAWNSGDSDRVIALLHPSAVIADPSASGGKVREPDVPDHVRARIAAGGTEVRDWIALAGVDSVAVICSLADGTRRADTLVLTDDGLIVRAMLHA
jgi:hypothetical protein